MEQIFPAAMEHIRLMETRIAQQEAANERLRHVGQDTSEGISRLKLLYAALEEMRFQLARLAPTDKQVAEPRWILPLMDDKREKRRSA
jgi:hypothetical protein